ncbi:unnamed protein product [Lactuca virosa]|uniref:BHLH domain-containing protein n=1 Tax=Lactuca virosa TaxID=75947 RepID=A0AAU9NM98_9ASTR|nr:unnamed protein product [Lactuca virosa]
MFSFQQSDELVFHEIPCSISFQQPATNQQDLIVELHNHVNMEGNSNISVSKARKRQGDQSPSSKPNSVTTDGGEGDCKDEHTQRKLVHREIERQRRQDMAKLYASLRGLLPLEFVKGKRSTSDHMHQAVNYIKHMQESIKVLSVKRDRLKKDVETSVPGPMMNSNEKNVTHPFRNTVSISSCKGGIQILINSGSTEGGVPLSAVLKAITEEGLNIITCTSTKVNERLLLSIQSEANDQVLTDLSMLQQRLTAVANDY